MLTLTNSLTQSLLPDYFLPGEATYSPLRIAAVADAGSDASVCQGTPLALSGLINNPESCGTQTWSVVSGSGIFSPDANAISPTFTPSSTGQITLQLTPCSSGGPCPVVADNITLNINEAPSLTFITARKYL